MSTVAEAASEALVPPAEVVNIPENEPEWMRKSSSTASSRAPTRLTLFESYITILRSQDDVLSKNDVADYVQLVAQSCWSCDLQPNTTESHAETSIVHFEKHMFTLLFLYRRCHNSESVQPQRAWLPRHDREWLGEQNATASHTISLIKNNICSKTAKQRRSRPLQTERAVTSSSRGIVFVDQNIDAISKFVNK